jgi:hypothetical protein
VLHKKAIFGAKKIKNEPFMPRKGKHTKSTLFAIQRYKHVYNMWSFEQRDFYFRALRSLVVLSFPQLVSFSSVFPKPLSETLRRSSDGRIPV